MKKIVLALFLLVGNISIFTSLVACQNVPPFTETCRHEMYSNKTRSTGMPTSYKVDLDADPLIRWNKVVKDKAEHIKVLINQVLKILNGISPKLVDVLIQKLPEIIGNLPAPYNQEIKGIAKATGLPEAEILLFNLFYEATSFCTSIVTQTSDGVLFHARNMDFGEFFGWDLHNHTWPMTEHLRNVMVEIEFVRNGTTIYKSITFAGYVGIFTGIKQNVFTLSVNSRSSKNPGILGVLEWILGGRSGHWTTFLTRDAFEKAQTYDEALQMLVNKEILAPVYFIVGGSKPGEGAVISRDREKAADVMKLGTAQNPWYVLQTNYDNWEEPPFFDDRRTSGKKCMDDVGPKNIDFSTLYDVLSTKPNLNQATVYTTLMQVNNFTFDTYIRYCPQPCYLW